MKNRIILCAPYGGVSGGIAHWTEHILKYYESTKDVSVQLTICPMGRSRFVNNSSFFYRLWAALIDYRAILANFHRLLSIQTYDIMHLTTSGSWAFIKDLLMLNMAKRHYIKTIIHFHFGRIPEIMQSNNWEYRFLRKVLNTVDAVIVIDQKSYNVLTQADYKNIYYVPNPISNEIIDMVEHIGVKHTNASSIVFAGHVVPTKGIYELIRACSSLEVDVNILGLYQDKIKREIELLSQDTKTKLHILGNQPMEIVIDYMSHCSLFVLPTYTEGFPNVILESMACACPIITTPVGAIPEMLNVESKTPCGKVVKVKDVDQLREAILYYLSHYEEAEAMGKRGKKRVQEMYSIAVVWSQMVSIWNSIITQ